jgi:uncharacterized protein with HEPN domain
MTQRKVCACLLDVEQACTMIGQFTSNKTLADYLGDPMVRSAVERQFEIIGEALKRVVGLDPAITRHVTDIASIVAFRNRLIHGYATVSDEVVWGIVQGKLPLLHREVRALLSESTDRVEKP